MKLSRLLAVLTLAFASQSNAEIIERQYDGFKLWIDCDLRGHVMYQYTLDKDRHNFERQSSFRLDPEVPLRCQQTSAKTYRKNGKSTFDRGHGVPFNTEFSKKSVKQSDFMVNVWPQHRDLNRGSMYRSEKIAECYRDIEPVHVFGGPLTNRPAVNRDYLKSHGIVTPGYFWKLLVTGDQAIAWVMPNMKGAVKSQLDNYIVSVRELESQVGMSFPVEERLKDQKPERSWPIPKGCHWG